MKICRKCDIEKELSEFFKHVVTKDGYRSQCKSCCKKYDEETYEKRKERLEKYYKENEAILKEKKKQYRLKNADKIKEYNKSRKDITKEYDKEYRKENVDQIKENKKQYYEDNKDYFKEKNKITRQNISIEKKREYNKRYYEKAETKQRIKNYRKERAENEPLYKLTLNIRKRISATFRLSGYKKGSKTEVILGCSFEHFREYIENKFKEGMCWENYGEWHLDHIVPISLAINEAQVYELNHYMNFQPLWEGDNLSKGNRFIG